MGVSSHPEEEFSKLLKLGLDLKYHDLNNPIPTKYKYFQTRSTRRKTRPKYTVTLPLSPNITPLDEFRKN